MTGSEAMAALADAWPDDGIAVVESPASTAALRNRLRISRPGSYYFTSSGGLGFAIAAAVGVQLAQSSRPVVCVLGEGSAQYGITALWTAVAYNLPVTYLVMKNDEYAILKWFAMLEQVSGAPGLDLPALDTAAIARGYGVPSVDANSREELTEALRGAIEVQDGPRLVQAQVAPGMWLE
jgi:benzoylformate decarboxylase